MNKTTIIQVALVAMLLTGLAAAQETNLVCSNLVSDANTIVISDSANVMIANIPAVATYNGNAYWAINSIPGATWIWSSYLANTMDYQTVQFSSSFNVPGNVISANLIVGVDDVGTVTLNSNAIGASYDTFGPSIYGNPPDVFNVVSNVINDSINQLQFTVTNNAGADPYSNPAGLLYNLTYCYQTPPTTTTVNTTTTTTISNGGGGQDFTGGLVSSTTTMPTTTTINQTFVPINTTTVQPSATTTVMPANTAASTTTINATTSTSTIPATIPPSGGANYWIILLIIVILAILGALAYYLTTHNKG